MSISVVEPGTQRHKINKTKGVFSTDRLQAARESSLERWRSHSRNVGRLLLPMALIVFFDRIGFRFEFSLPHPKRHGYCIALSVCVLAVR
jgi:hypothetical protein